MKEEEEMEEEVGGEGGEEEEGGTEQLCNLVFVFEMCCFWVGNNSQPG